ncbi:MAG TPA: hypothetical protein VLN48_11205 [Bryobacteraceae bacterium]|nr:hypothetical protein [Bryobacteraceae bacterium]
MSPITPITRITPDYPDYPTAHTRGYGEMYLRIKGVVPPTYNV